MMGVCTLIQCCKGFQMSVFPDVKSLDVCEMIPWIIFSLLKKISLKTKCIDDEEKKIYLPTSFSGLLTKVTGECSKSQCATCCPGTAEIRSGFTPNSSSKTNKQRNTAIRPRLCCLKNIKYEKYIYKYTSIRYSYGPYVIVCTIITCLASCIFSHSAFLLLTNNARLTRNIYRAYS